MLVEDYKETIQFEWHIYNLVKNYCWTCQQTLKRKLLLSLLFCNLNGAHLNHMRYEVDFNLLFPQKTSPTQTGLQSDQ